MSQSTSGSPSSHPRRLFLKSTAVGALAVGIAAPRAQAAAAEPDFGPNVKIFDPSTPVATINAYLQGISGEAEFSSNRHAVLFKPGVYGSAAGQDNPSTATGIVNSKVVYYTSIAGLGASPDDVLVHGALHVEPVQNADGTSTSLTQFWRSLSNLAINPIQRPVGADAQRPRPEGIAEPHTMRWAVSQAAPLRRVHIKGNLDLTGRYGATAFGTYTADSVVDGSVISGDATREYAQAQWLTRNSRIGRWDGKGVSYVFSGVQGAPATNFAPGDKTTLAQTPLSREAPFLVFDRGAYKVFVPAAKRNTSGPAWSTNASAGRYIPIEQFHIARPSQSAATINAALASGKHLLLTPGVYALNAPLRVTRADTVVMGLGYATLAPAARTRALEIGDVPGVVVSSLTVDSGPDADVLVQVGPSNAAAGLAANPTALLDLFVRVGGPRAGQANTSVQVNSNHVILDHTWLWRGDHGTGIGWDVNRADTGLVVNGDDVTALGLFVEHYQKHQVIWNGERGQTVFYQSEMPYDPPNQAAWMNGAKEGYASYVVGSGVRTHKVTGLVVYSLFTAGFQGIQVHASSAAEAPRLPGVSFRSLATGVIAGGGGIRHMLNDDGPAVDATAPNQTVFGMTAVQRISTL
ncbi:hypothetical protein [Kineosporia sp. NBRC 101677]|uniref:hypothetical protein n=1 Tax=Kineosporia sp. NBRC 101677 TaxID=3032197 RepID=UPI0025546555|nr:hypothetical protein [Kineosporia sp. NBRC 101677]